MSIKVFSYGGGVQSTAALVLAATGKIDYQAFLFCNVGDDSEHPATLAYVHDIAMPYAKEHGIKLFEVHKVSRDGTPETLYSRLMRSNSKSIEIPVRMANGAPGNRSCTGIFKIKVVDKWLRYMYHAHLYGAIVGLGISLDEFQRMRPNMDPDTIGWKENAFPLIDLRMDRQQCVNVIQRAGLSVPPKSSCFFCPYRRLSVWQAMRHHEPELFEKAVDIEKKINERRARLGKDQVWLTAKLKPLDQATTDMEQMNLFDDDICESGYCFM